jgi:crotonobetainyl-CoA:carnitine CoA-transferase CaiB-like acyl-CoA transferase
MDEPGMERLFATAAASSWQGLFAAANLACIRADVLMPKFFWQQPGQAAFRTPSVHAEWGAFDRPGSLCRFDRLPQAKLDPPLAGQHSKELLALTGRTGAEIEALLSHGVVA